LPDSKAFADASKPAWQNLRWQKMKLDQVAETNQPTAFAGTAL
jgi:hypothetical protein